jgi:hypothetical protein
VSLRVVLGTVGALTFRTTLQKRGPAAVAVLDDQQVSVLGEGARRFPVRATVNGYTWRTSVARMGGEFLVGLNQEVRRGARRRGSGAQALELLHEAKAPPSGAADHSNRTLS